MHAHPGGRDWFSVVKDAPVAGTELELVQPACVCDGSAGHEGRPRRDTQSTDLLQQRPVAGIDLDEFEAIGHGALDP
jgi:hypothetical protein